MNTCKSTKHLYFSTNACTRNVTSCLDHNNLVASEIPYLKSPNTKLHFPHCFLFLYYEHPLESDLMNDLKTDCFDLKSGLKLCCCHAPIQCTVTMIRRTPKDLKPCHCVTRCNFSCNLQCNSTLGRCKIGKYKFPSKFADVFLTYQTFDTNLHHLRVEFRCKLQEKLHCGTGTLVRT